MNSLEVQSLSFAVRNRRILERLNLACAKVTHEAAVGTVDRRQPGTRMAHRLAPEEAVAAIITGILR